jgi:hypothetical protein
MSKAESALLTLNVATYDERVTFAQIRAALEALAKPGYYSLVREVALEALADAEKANPGDQVARDELMSALEGLLEAMEEDGELS